MILAMAILAMVALLAVACTDADDPEVEPSILAVQNAEFATFASSGETFTLTMEGADDTSVWFTDRPFRDAGTEDTGVMMDRALNPANPDGPPNAAVVWAAGGEEHAVAVELLSGEYDAEAATLTYEVLPLESHNGNLDHFGTSAEIPTERVGPVTVFVDNIWGGYCDMDITNEAEVEPGVFWTVDVKHGFEESNNGSTGNLDVGDKVVWEWMTPAFDYWCEVTVSLYDVGTSADTDDPVITYYMINPNVGSSDHEAKCSAKYKCATKTLHNAETYHVILVFCEAGVDTTTCLARGGYDNPQ